MKNTDFSETINKSYNFTSPSISLGRAKLGDAVYTDTEVKVPLKMFNRHGLITGATGTGKTKTLQLISEGLSKAGVPVILMDIKGDLSGISMGGEKTAKLEERNKLTANDSWAPIVLPSQFFTLTSENSCIPLRTTISEFGPILISKILELNETQQSLMAVLFRFCDDKKLPLVDLSDLKKVINFASNEGQKLIEQEYGKMNSVSTATILRKIIEIESSGASTFFGEPSTKISDLLFNESVSNNTTNGLLNIIRLIDIYSKPTLFSTFMMGLINEVYEEFDEVGDTDKPRLVIFLDEAHLLFRDASKEFIQNFETLIRIIRSKGVGIFFVTQSPTDIPSTILAQLSLKVQHSLRAFSAIDRKNINLVSQNFPESKFYKVSELITNLGVGEALITGLNDQGIPTELASTVIYAPETRMDVVTNQEIAKTMSKNNLVAKYITPIDPESAKEMLSKGIFSQGTVTNQTEAKNTDSGNGGLGGFLNEFFGRGSIGNQVVKQIARTASSTVTRDIVRGIMGGRTR